MSIFDELAARGFNMLEAFKDFHSILDQLKNERQIAGYRPEPVHENPEEFQGTENAEVEDESAPMYYCEDFPGRKFFRREDLNMEDPAFYSGKEIGIPVAVAVHSNDRQNKQIPSYRAED